LARQRPKPPTPHLPEPVRRAVERTVESTRGSARSTRGRAQDLVDDATRIFEHQAEAAAGVPDRVRGALGDLRFATRDEVFDTFLRLHPKLKDTFFLNTKEEDSDPYESSQLTPGATIELFRLINEHGAQGTRPISESARCPTCRGALTLTHDILGTNRIVYYRCRAGHG
jgi:hypothetical protein